MVVNAAAQPTRERLLGSARELLEVGGYSAASVSAVARRAGVADGTLYRHFASKAELFVEVFRAAAERELGAMAEAGRPPGTVGERLERVVETFARRALHNRRLAWALVYEPVDPVVDAERLAYRREYRAAMAALLREGIAAGELPDQDADLAAAALVGAIAEALVGPLSPLGGAQPSEEAIVESLLTFCRHAVGAPRS